MLRFARADERFSFPRHSTSILPVTADPLDGARVKIDRAWEHIKSLEKEIDSLPNDAKRVRLAQKFNPKTNTIEVRTELVPELPPRWGAIVGDVLQNFRSALNYMAWELAKWNLADQGKTRRPKGSTQFPITKDAKRFGDCRTTKHLIDIHPEHIMVIEYLQPYGGAYLSCLDPFILRTPEFLKRIIEDHPLLILNKFSNIDKHQTLQPVFFGAEPIHGPIIGIDCEIVRTRAYVIPRVFQLNTKWFEFEVRPTSPNPRVKMQDTFMPQIAFRQGDIAMATLAHIGEAVTEVFVAVKRLI